MWFLTQWKCQVHFQNRNGKESTGCGRGSCRKQHSVIKQQAQEWGVPGFGVSESLTPHLSVHICIYMCAWALQSHEVWAPTQNSGKFWFKIWPPGGCLEEGWRLLDVSDFGLCSDFSFPPGSSSSPGARGGHSWSLLWVSLSVTDSSSIPLNPSRACMVHSRGVLSSLNSKHLTEWGQRLQGRKRCEESFISMAHI